MDKSKAVQELVKVFRQYGYEGATLSRISKATGLGRASLYHYFSGGKKEMAEAVLDYANQWFESTVLAPLQSSGEPRERLQAMSESLAQFYNHGRDSCLLSVFTLGDDDLFHRQVQQALNIWIDSLTQVLTEAGFSVEQAHQRAEDAVMQIQGALVLTRGLDNTAPFERTLQQIPPKLLESA